MSELNYRATFGDGEAIAAHEFGRHMTDEETKTTLNKVWEEVNARDWAVVKQHFEAQVQRTRRTISDPAELDLAVFDAMVAEERNLWTYKGAEYTNGGDRLANFTRIAANLGLTPLQVWSVYVNKHWDAVHNYIRTGMEGVEGIESRLADIAVYAKLARLLVRAKKKEERV